MIKAGKNLVNKAGISFMYLRAGLRHACLISRPPVLTNRCCRLVNDQWPTRSGSLGETQIGNPG